MQRQQRLLPGAEATEAPAGAEATEAPVATVAPTTSGSSYDNDSYYDKALSLCSALGIITGYEDGSVKPDSKVTMSGNGINCSKNA